MATTASPHVFDATAETFETDVLQSSLQTPVLVDFWAEWCGPCKTLGPILEKLAGEYNGAFRLAKIDVDKEQQLAAAFQVRSIPTVYLVKDGQLVDGFPGALPEGQLREFLTHHGIVPGTPQEEVAPEEVAPAPPVDPHAEVMRLRKLVETEADKPEHRLDLALALLQTGNAHEAEQLLDALPANLEAAISSDPKDLRARHLLGVHRIVSGDAEAGLEQFLEMLRLDRTFDEGLPRKALIDAFQVVDDPELVGRVRRQMASLLLV
jgi:putative thioredoxin